MYLTLIPEWLKTEKTETTVNWKNWWRLFL